MKIGILLIGVSYNTTIGRHRDFRLSSNNFYDMIYNPLKENNELFIYTTTYGHEHINTLLDTYKPNKNQILPENNSHQRLTYIKALELIENENLDIVITTRYDIDFHKKITEINLDLTKFNFLFKELNTWSDHRFVDDNLFVFPFKYLEKFKESILEIHHGEFKQFNFLHNVYKPLLNRIGEDNLHITSPEHELSHSNSFYTLRRI